MQCNVGLWSIAVTCGHSLNELRNQIPMVPIIGPDCLSSIGGKAAADPFGIYVGDRWYVFFEMFHHDCDRASIAVASSADLERWDLHGIAIREKHHLSYPFVFKHGDDIFMMPESKSIGRVNLYRASQFPMEWEFHSTLLDGRYMDASMVCYNDRYWLFAGYRSYLLKLFYADSPFGPWRRHWMPVVRNYSKRSARPGGRPVVIGDKLIRPAQDCVVRYGHQLRLMHVTRLSRLWYAERPLFREAYLQPGGTGWRSCCMHHIDIHTHSDGEMIAFVDGAN